LAETDADKAESELKSQIGMEMEDLEGARTGVRYDRRLEWRWKILKGLGLGLGMCNYTIALIALIIIIIIIINCKWSRH
jgi:hypothetical protein